MVIQRTSPRIEIEYSDLLSGSSRNSVPAWVTDTRTFDVAGSAANLVSSVTLMCRKGRSYSRMVPVKFSKRKSWTRVLLVLVEFGFGPV